MIILSKLDCCSTWGGFIWVVTSVVKYTVEKVRKPITDIIKVLILLIPIQSQEAEVRLPHLCKEKSHLETHIRQWWVDLFLLSHFSLHRTIFLNLDGWSAWGAFIWGCLKRNWFSWILGISIWTWIWGLLMIFLNPQISACSWLKLGDAWWRRVDAEHPKVVPPSFCFIFLLLLNFVDVFIRRSTNMSVLSRVTPEISWVYIVLE